MRRTHARVALSAVAEETATAPLAGFRRWWEERRAEDASRVDRIPFAELRCWSFTEGTGDLVHDSGRFFQVRGAEVHRPEGPVPQWSQPLLHQPEVGILGLLAKEFDGVLHFLVQAKTEPGNRPGLQLSPTVQATLSNYSGVHGGRAVPYLEHFLHRDARRVLVDVRQSEQGSWFFRKRNRNMVVEVAGDVEVREGFRWMTLGQLHRLLAEGTGTDGTDSSVVNMDTRSILSCLPFPFDGVPRAEPSGDLLTWLTEARSRERVRVERVPLAGLPEWRREPDRIAHRNGAFFSIVAVRVRAGEREVTEWTQPLLRPHGVGVSAFLTKSVDGARHVLANLRVEPGNVDVLEIGPTVQCTPENFAHLPAAAGPPLLRKVLDAPRERLLFDTVLAEEGGRFQHARSRYLIVEADDDPYEPPGHRWVPVAELLGLLRHSHYVNVEARTLIACLQSVCVPGPGRPGEGGGR